MDKLVIKDLSVFANHGCLPEEKSLGQKFSLDLEFSLNTQPSALTGDLKKSIDYAEISHKAAEIFAQKKL